MILQTEPYSYRDDPAVPGFDDKGPVVFMDGDCALCTLGARMIARFDKAGDFRICRVQTPLGQAILRHYGLSPDDPDTWLYLADGQAYSSLDAVIRAFGRMGAIGWLLQPLRLLPRGMRDGLYRLIARNRYRIFGRTDMCAVPDPRLQARLME